MTPAGHIVEREQHTIARQLAQSDLEHGSEYVLGSRRRTWSAGAFAAMASIERTTYPRYRRVGSG